MPIVYPAPDWVQHFHKNSGALADGWKVYTFESNSEDYKPAYSDSTGDTLHQPAITLNARGEYPGEGLYLIADEAYTLELRDEFNVPVRTVNNIVAGGGSGSGGDILFEYQWLADAVNFVAPPNPTTIRWDNDTQVSSGELFFSATTNDGSDPTDFFQNVLEPGNNFTLASETGGIQLWEVSAVQDLGTYFQVSATFVRGTYEFTDGEVVTFDYGVSQQSLQKAYTGGNEIVQSTGKPIEIFAADEEVINVYGEPSDENPQVQIQKDKITIRDKDNEFLSNTSDKESNSVYNESGTEFAESKHEIDGTRVYNADVAADNGSSDFSLHQESLRSNSYSDDIEVEDGTDSINKLTTHDSTAHIESTTVNPGLGTFDAEHKITVTGTFIEDSKEVDGGASDVQTVTSDATRVMKDDQGNEVVKLSTAEQAKLNEGAYAENGAIGVIEKAATSVSAMIPVPATSATASITFLLDTLLAGSDVIVNGIYFEAVDTIPVLGTATFATGTLQEMSDSLTAQINGYTAGTEMDNITASNGNGSSATIDLVAGAGAVGNTYLMGWSASPNNSVTVVGFSGGADATVELGTKYTIDGSVGQPFVIGQPDIANMEIEYASFQYGFTYSIRLDMTTGVLPGNIVFPATTEWLTGEAPVWEAKVYLLKFYYANNGTVYAFSEEASSESGGVQEVVAGTNVTVTGPADAPIVNVPVIGGEVDSVVAGANVSVDNTDPANPIVSADDQGQVDSVVAGTNVTVDNTDPVNPIVSVPNVGGQVNSVVGSDHISVDSFDPANPVIINEGIRDFNSGDSDINVDKTNPRIPVISFSGSGNYVPVTDVDKLYRIERFTGADLGAKIIAALPTIQNGGVIDCTNYTNVVLEINSTITLDKPVTIILPPTEVVCAVGAGNNVFNIESDSVRIMGYGRSTRGSTLLDTSRLRMTDGLYHVYSRGHNVITLKDMDLVGVKSSGEPRDVGRVLDGSGGVYIEKPNPGTTSGGNNVNELQIHNLLIDGTYAHGIYVDTPILSNIVSVRVSEIAGHGFFLWGGTSTNFTNCYASQSDYSGFCIYAHTYGSLLGCAAEFAGIGYWFRSSYAMTTHGCGAEYCTNRGSNAQSLGLTTTDSGGGTVNIPDISTDYDDIFRGNSIAVTGGQSINVNAFKSANPSQPHATSGTSTTSRHIYINGNARDIAFQEPNLSISSGETYSGRFDIEISDLGASSPSGIRFAYNPANGTVVPVIPEYITDTNNSAYSTYIWSETESLWVGSGNDLWTVSGGDYFINGVAIGGGGGGGTVDTVVAGNGISVDSTDPANPIVTNTIPAIQMEPTGFLDPENVIVTYDETARTITLTGTTTCYWQGEELTAVTSGWVSDPHAASPTTGLFLYYNGTSFVWSTSPWAFTDMMIAYVAYDSSSNFLFGVREPHGLMQHQVHKELHEVIGTHRENGSGQLSSYVLESTTAGDRRPIVAACEVHDEDLTTVIPTLNNDLYTQLTLSGTSTVNFTVDAADIVPLSTNRPYYNEWNGSAWVQTLMSNNDYMNVWLVAMPTTADSDSQDKRFMWMQGQSQFQSEIGARNDDPRNINFGDLSTLSPEFVVITQLIINYSSNNWEIVDVINIEGTKISQTTVSGGIDYTKFPYIPQTEVPTPTVEGLSYYNADTHNLVIQTGTDVNLDVGRENWVRGYNATGSTITNGQVVYVMGGALESSEIVGEIALAKSDVKNTTTFVGIATQDITHLSAGEITISGIVHDVDTSAFTEGDVLYVSSTTAGALTNTAVAFPNYNCKVGRVLTSSATTGAIFVAPDVDPPIGGGTAVAAGIETFPASLIDGTLSMGTSYISTIVIPQQNITLNSLSVYCTQTGSNTSTRLGVYTRGSSDVLLGQTANFTGSFVAGINTFNLTTPLSLNANTSYMLAIQTNTNATSLGYTSGKLNGNAPNHFARADLNNAQSPASGMQTPVGFSQSTDRIWIGGS